MPYVSVRVTRDGVTAEQKRRMVEQITRTLVEVLGKRPEHIHDIIDEVEPENRGFAGVLTTDLRPTVSLPTRPGGGKAYGSGGVFCGDASYDLFL